MEDPGQCIFATGEIAGPGLGPEPRPKSIKQNAGRGSEQGQHK
jgi:hypothetical protein